MRYSIVIPTVNQTHLVDQCIETFKAHHNHDYEIIVVDDGSPQQTVDKLKQICAKHQTYLISGGNENRGFSHTVNMGIRAATGDVIVLVNNDIIFTNDVLAPMGREFSNDPELGVVGARLLYPDRRIQHAGVIRSNRYEFMHIHKNVHESFIITKSNKYYPAVTGALFGISRRCVDAVGYFNERYFVACEDVEYCLRVWINGLKVLYCASAEAIHIEGYTRGNTDEAKRIKGEYWRRKEQETIKLFTADLTNFDLNGIERRVNTLNADLIKSKTV